MLQNDHKVSTSLKQFEQKLDFIIFKKVECIAGLLYLTALVLARCT